MQEAQLYLELRACTCGQDRFQPVHELQRRGDDLIARFTGPCRTCGATRTYEFVMERETSSPPAFGGQEASRLLDAGEFLWASDQAAARVPVNVSGLTPRRRGDAMADLRYAIAALQEVAKFIPGGADAVPVEAVSSELGQVLYRADPERFTREVLQEHLASYREGLADLEGVAAGG